MRSKGPGQAVDTSYDGTVRTAVEQAMQMSNGIRGDVAAPSPGALRASGWATQSGARAAPSLQERASADLARRLGLEFSDLSSALRVLLARAVEQGEEGIPAVLAKLERALEQTGRELRKAGYDKEEVAVAVDALRDRLSAAAAAGAEDTAAQFATYQRRDKASLAITTQDGDRVQIRFRGREGIVAQTTSIAAGAEERRVYAFSSGRIEIVVQGELDEQELAAIGELVGKVEALAADFFAGDAGKAFAAAAALGFDSEQIAGFALRLASRVSVRQTSLVAAPVATAAEGAAIAPTPVMAGGSAAAEASVATTSGDDAAAASPAPEPQKQTAPASARTTLAEYLRTLLDTLATPSGAGRYSFSMRWKLEVVIAAVRAQQSPANPDAGSALLVGSLATLAEQVSQSPMAQAAA